jgi:hypothetical protein
MSRFNDATLNRAKTARTPNTVNLAGGDAFAQDAELELASLVTTSMTMDQFYRSADQGLARMRELVTAVDPVYAAKAAVYTRQKDGLRSISHAVAGEIAHNVKGEKWTKDFYRAVVRRPDDVTEILAYYLSNYGKPVPNSLKKGLGASFAKFDAYQLAKYRGENDGLSLVDAVRLIRPRPTERNATALAQLIAGTLRSTGTWEAKVSAAGSAENVEEAKQEAWAELLEKGTIGYLALLRNLRNIAAQAPGLVGRACELLTDQERVEKSLVLPFQFMIARHELDGNPVLVRALSEAVDLSLANIPDLGERVLVAVDGSGSMAAPVAGNALLTRKGVGSLFAAALYKRNLADVIVFGSTAGPVSGLNPTDSTLTIADRIFEACYGHSTNFHTIFSAAKRGHDTIVIFSDMQAWVTQYGYGNTPARAFQEYKGRWNASPKVFAFDLAGYGTSQFPEKDVYQLAGFSDKSLALMSQYRTDPRAIVTAIKAIEF